MHRIKDKVIVILSLIVMIVCVLSLVYFITTRFYTSEDTSVVLEYYDDDEDYGYSGVVSNNITLDNVYDELSSINDVTVSYVNESESICVLLNKYNREIFVIVDSEEIIISDINSKQDSNILYKTKLDNDAIPEIKDFIVSYVPDISVDNDYGESIEIKDNQDGTISIIGD